MGNVVDFSRPTFGGPPVIPKDNSWNGVTWEDFVKGRAIPQEIPLNGYNFSGCVVPEPVLEAILCRLPEEDILKCNFVCRAWKDLLIRKSFWKLCYDYRGLDWNKVPSHIREKPGSWMVLYAQYRNKIFTKNYISNPSGHSQFDGWNVYKNGGDRWLVENSPVGCELLPDDAFFGPNDKSCFVTSYQWCSKYFVVDLWDNGLNPITMRMCLPLEIKCSQMYVSRFDCGGVFRWELRILDSHQKIIQDHKAVIELPPSSDWKTAEHSFKFKTTHAECMNEVRYLVFIHEGRDSQFWSGHYGMKFARACVTVQCLENDPESEFEADETAHEDSSSDYGGND